MRWALISSALDKKLKVVFSDKLLQRLITVTKRNYCERRIVKEQFGYRRTATGESREKSDRGYLILNPKSSFILDSEETSETLLQTLIFPFTTFLLGIWQVKRQFWKTDLKNFLTSRYDEEPLPLPENSVGQFDVLGMGMYENHPFYSSLEDFDFSELEYRRIKVRGEFEYDKEIYLGPRTGPVPLVQGASNFGIGEHKTPGYYVITPFKLEGRNVRIMVNRGFLPDRMMNEKTLKEAQVHGTQELVGILRFDQDTRYIKYLVGGDIRKPQHRDGMTMFMVRQIEPMAQLCGAAPIYMECLPKKFKQFTPTITATTKVELRDDHTTYAIIWFSLSILTIWMWYSAYRPGGHSTLLIRQTMEKQKNFKRNPRIK